MTTIVIRQPSQPPVPGVEQKDRRTDQEKGVKGRSEVSAELVTIRKTSLA